MEEYCIIRRRGTASSIIRKRDANSTEQVNIVEKEMQTEQSKLVNVATQKSLSKPYRRSEGM